MEKQTRLIAENLFMREVLNDVLIKSKCFETAYPAPFRAICSNELHKKIRKALTSQYTDRLAKQRKADLKVIEVAALSKHCGNECFACHEIVNSLKERDRVYGEKK